MEKKFSAPADKVFALLTDPKWLEARCLALGELSASCKTKKSAGGVTVTMKRRVHRELNAVISRVLNPDSDVELEEHWTVEKDRREGTYDDADHRQADHGDGRIRSRSRKARAACIASSTMPRCGCRSSAAWSNDSSWARPSRAAPTNSTTWLNSSRRTSNGSRRGSRDEQEFHRAGRGRLALGAGLAAAQAASGRDCRQGFRSR